MEELKDLEKVQEEKAWCVYVHINNTNGKKYYGITSQDPEVRWKNGCGYHTQTYFKNAIDKYGWDNFQHIILHDNLTYEEAINLEKYYINFDKTNVCKWGREAKGYNMTDGGEGIFGKTHSDEVKQKISKHSIEMWKDPNTRAKIIAKRSGEYNINYGKNLSDDVKQKISQSRKGKCVGEENGFYGQHHTDEMKNYLRSIKSKKPVASEIGVFESVKDAARCTNTSSSHISECCNNKRKTEGYNPHTGERLHWRYATLEEYNNYLNSIKGD